MIDDTDVPNNSKIRSMLWDILDQMDGFAEVRGINSTCRSRKNEKILGIPIAETGDQITITLSFPPSPEDAGRGWKMSDSPVEIRFAIACCTFSTVPPPELVENLVRAFVESSR